ncbi:MAG: NTP transferase domain-containing protein [Rhizobiaceae bacterium]
MKFGSTPIDEAEGAILAHGVKADNLVLKKATKLTAHDIENLNAANIREVVVARLDPDDVSEDDAAWRIAASISGDGFEARSVSTGRVNLHAVSAGLFVVDAEMVNRLNAIDPSMTIATLRNHASVTAGQMIATVKVIPFAVPNDLVDLAQNAAGNGKMLEIHHFRPSRIGLIQTVLGGTRENVLDKTVRITEARLERSGSEIAGEVRCNHDIVTLADAIKDASASCDLVIVFGASATSDPDDVIPAAITASGGKIVHVGMPVDPGNLITVGERLGVPVIGAPGCARSPKENGFDWVLDRLLAGIPVTSADIETMGVGGLLGEIPARPRPRDIKAAKDKPKIHAILLAAGQSTRMGGPNKLLATFDGVPLVRRSCMTLVEGGLPITVVTGHQSERIKTALAGLDVRFVQNKDYATGLSSSLKTGTRAVAGDVDGVLVALSDMPGVNPVDIGRLTKAFETSQGQAIVRATHEGKRGNPVILPKAVLPLIEQIEGDVGARQLVESGDTPVVDVEIGGAASLDVDTPERLRAAGGTIGSADG